MRTTRLAAKAMEPAKVGHGLTLTDEKENKLSVESLNLSPERIMEGASLKTALLNQILAQQQHFHQLRDWGINE